MIPDELKQIKQWLVSHTHRSINGRPDKAPRDLKGNLVSEAVRNSSFCTYKEAVRYAAERGCSYGFYLMDEDPYIVVDLDNHGSVNRNFQPVIDEFNSWTERSFSGNGYHIWIRGRIDSDRASQDIQIYSRHRYIICTDDVVNDVPIKKRQQTVERYIKKFPVKHCSQLTEYPTDKSDEAVLAEFKKNRPGAYELLYVQGNEKQLYASNSEADHAMISYLCRYTKSNEQVRRIFQESLLGIAKAEREPNRDLNSYVDFSLKSIRKPELDELAPRIRTFSELIKNYGEPEWLVQDYWMCRSHGIISAAPKAFKTTLALDMLFSIASGQPFLGKPVKQGTALFIQAENSERMLSNSIRRIMKSKGLHIGSVKCNGGRLKINFTTREYPLYEYQFPAGFSFTDPENTSQLENTISELKPAVVMLDPLYLMAGSSDINLQTDMSPILKWCIATGRQYNCAVILIHHDNKTRTDFGGSGTIHLSSFTDSAWSLSKTASDDTIILRRRFREAGGFPDQEIRVYETDKKYQPTVKNLSDSKSDSKSKPKVEHRPREIDPEDKESQVLSAIDAGAKNIRQITDLCSWTYRNVTRKVIMNLLKDGKLGKLTAKKLLDKKV